jgi:hypothetical protein
VAHHQWLYGTFLVPAEPPKPICLPHNQRSVRPSPSLTSTTPHIAAKGEVVLVGAPSASAAAAGTTGPAFVSFTGPWPLLEAKDGARNAPVAAASTIAFSTSTKTWVFLGASPRPGIPLLVQLYNCMAFFGRMDSSGFLVQFGDSLIRESLSEITTKQKSRH